MPPLRHRRADLVPGFQQEEVEAAFGQVRGGGQADRPGADHDDRQRAGVTCAHQLVKLKGGGGAAASVAHDGVSWIGEVLTVRGGAPAVATHLIEGGVP
ncbi:hypothetical protein GCM10012289_04780 [Nonomuraea cavernae]|uniref:Uncharacterized protein n=1 Tax=Nonomuraea cavernae TaxID=2045107 RepID=A0A917YQW6_9ACTN|nr:hypothetical protein GCM10012289_04780 [Nonomuraea cavernae]